MIAQPLRAGRQFSDMGDGQSNVVIGIVEQNNKVSTPNMISLRANPAQPLIAFYANQNLRDVGEDIAPTLLHSGDGKKAHGAYPKLSIAGTLQSHSKKHGHAMTTQQAAENNQLISSTVVTGMGKQNKPEHIISGARRLTPTECERLQGFPDGWTEGFSDSMRYRMLGNAVAVPCASWIRKRIIKVESWRVSDA